MQHVTTNFEYKIEGKLHLKDLFDGTGRILRVTEVTKIIKKMKKKIQPDRPASPYYLCEREKNTLGYIAIKSQKVVTAILCTLAHTVFWFVKEITSESNKI